MSSITNVPQSSDIMMSGLFFQSSLLLPIFPFHLFSDFHALHFPHFSKLSAGKKPQIMPKKVSQDVFFFSSVPKTLRKFLRNLLLQPSLFYRKKKSSQDPTFENLCKTYLMKTSLNAPSHEQEARITRKDFIQRNKPKRCMPWNIPGKNFSELNSE